MHNLLARFLKDKKGKSTLMRDAIRSPVIHHESPCCGLFHLMDGNSMPEIFYPNVQENETKIKKIKATKMIGYVKVLSKEL